MLKFRVSYGGCLLLMCSCLLVACTSNVKNTREAKLMPAEVAKKILNKFAESGWTSNPWGTTVGNPFFCRPTRVALKLSETTKAVVSINGKMISVMKHASVSGISCDSNVMYQFKADRQFTEQEIDDVVDALVSLGAKIPEITREK